MKQVCKKLLCTVLTLALVLQLCPVYALGTSDGNASDAKESVSSKQNSVSTTVFAEETSLREESVKHFRMSDGTYTAVQYPFPAHYSSDSGWQDYDNTPKPIETEAIHGYLIENGSETRSFSTDGTANSLYSVTSGKTAVSFSLQPRDSEELHYDVTVSEKDSEESDVSGFIPENLTSQLSYSQILPNLSLTYTLYGPNLKEDIILEKQPKTPELSFYMEVEGLSAEQQPDGSILLSAEDGTAVWQLDAPYMYDSTGAFSDQVHYELTPDETGSGYLLTVIADPDWLSAQDRVYPVVIDPSLTKITNGTGSSQPITTTFLREKVPNGSGCIQMQYWGWGCTSVTGQLTGIARVNTLPEIPEGGVMTSATISYYFDSYSGCNMTSAKLGVREITSGLPSGASSWYDYIYNLTWNTKPDISDDFLDTVVVSNATKGRVVWDITRAVKKWYEDSNSNLGLAFDLTNPEDCSTTTGACGRFYGYANTWYPIFTVNYRDTVGIEEYYTAQTLPADRAGTVYVGDYSGQITLIRTDAVLASTVLTGSVSHVYNSAFSDTLQPEAMDGTGMYLGKGWSMDAVQSVETVSGVLTYTDGDGTRHAFTRSGSSGPYSDEDGLGLTLTKTASSPETYELSNDSGDKLTFVNGLLYEKSDAYGNKLQYQYNTSNYMPAGTTADRLASIVLILNGSSATATVAAFTWNSGGYLTSVTDFSGNLTSYNYTGNLLTSVTLPDGMVVSYTYDSASNYALSMVKDQETQYNLRFSWYAGTVSGWQEYDNNTLGIGVTVSRSTESAAYTFDGRSANTPKRTTVYLFDYEGRSVNCYTRNADGSIVYSAASGEYTTTETRSRKNNRVTVSGSMGIAENNRITNGDFESGTTGWTITNGSVSSSGKLNSNGLVLNGNPNIDASASTTVSNLNAPGTLSYMFSGWAKAAAMPNAGSVTEEVFRLRAEILYSDGSTEEHSQSFHTDVTEWQYLSFAVVPEQSDLTVSSVTCYCEYLKNNGDACFDNLTLTQELSQTYVYDDNGNVTTVSDGQTNSPVYSFNTTGDLTSFTARDGVTYDYSYGSYHNVTSVTDGTVTADFEYDAVGNITETLLTGTIDALAQETASFTVSVTESSTPVYSSPGGSTTGTEKTIGTMLTVTALQKTGSELYGRIGTDNWVKLSHTNYRNDDTPVSVTASSVNVRSGPGTNYSVMTAVTRYTKLTITETATGSGYTWGKIKSNGYWLVLSYTTYSSVHGTTGGTGNPQWQGEAAPTLLSTSGYSTAAGNSLQTSAVNTNGEETTYSYGTNLAKQYGLPTAVTTPDGVTTTTTYDDDNGRLTQTEISGYAALNYSYTAKGELSQLQRSFTRSGSTLTQSYSMTYGSFGDLLSVSVGNRTLATYTRNQYTGDLETFTYGNNDTIQYSYNDIDQLVSTSYNGVARFQYSYDASGQLSSVTDLALNRSYQYSYDSLSRLISSAVKKNNTAILSTTAGYDSSGRLSSAAYNVNGRAQNYSYGYNNLGLLSSETTPVNTVSYSYDGLERLDTVTAGSIYTKSYSYAAPSGTAGSTTGLVSELSYEKADGTSLTEFQYTYDAMGRIASDGSYQYNYDALGQLTTVKDSSGNTLESYSYDGAGNLLGAIKNGTAHTYSYGDSDWKDLLTSYDGQSITYDAIGNPLTYLGSTLTWQNGRQLASYSNSADNLSISYSYDVNGLRTEKAVTQNGVTTNYEYLYDGSTLLQERIGTSKILNFLYMADGTPYALEYSTDGGSSYTTYYYLTNLQGDIISILNSSGTPVVTYSYDSWGDITSTTGTLAATLGTDNPLRYRGYCYDEETELYYVTSRYYNPEVGRFINADDSEMIDGCNEYILEYNLFVYCFNNSVNMADDTGYWPQWATNLIKVGIGVLAIGIGVAATVATGGAAAPVLVASLKIAVTSAAIGAAVGAGTNALNHRVSTGSWNGTGEAALSGAVDGAADGFMLGGISAGATFTVVAAKGAKIQQIGNLKPNNKSGKGYQGVQYKNQRGSLKSFELHSPHKSGQHQQWHWQQNTWNPKTGGITGRSIHWTLFGRRF